MNIPIQLNFYLIVFVIELAITISSLYAAWINLVQKRISTVGFDAFILLFFSKRKAIMIRENPRLIARMGIVTMLVGIGSASEVFSIFIQNIWPYVH